MRCFEDISFIKVFSLVFFLFQFHSLITIRYYNIIHILYHHLSMSSICILSLYFYQCIKSTMFFFLLTNSSFSYNTISEPEVYFISLSLNFRLFLSVLFVLVLVMLCKAFTLLRFLFGQIYIELR